MELFLLGCCLLPMLCHLYLLFVLQDSRCSKRLTACIYLLLGLWATGSCIVIALSFDSLHAQWLFPLICQLPGFIVIYILEKTKTVRFLFTLFFTLTLTNYCGGLSFLIGGLVGNFYICLPICIGLCITLSAIIRIFFAEGYRQAICESQDTWILMTVNAVFFYLFTLLLAYYPTPLQYRPEDYLTISICEFLMILAMFTFVHVIIRTEQQNKKQLQLEIENRTAAWHAALAEREFHADMESMNRVRKMRHDIEHHFSVIAGYLSEDRTADALEYIASANALMPKRSFSGKNIITGNFVDQYRTLCEQNQIAFSEDMRYDESLFSNRITLGIILGNGLKNAFESALTAEGSLRFVSISGKQVHDHVAIIIKNGFHHKINSDFKSTKSEGRGLGISNIRDAAEKCGGYSECSHKDFVFTLEVVFVAHS